MMAESHAKKTQIPWPKVVVLTLMTLAFIWFAWFVYNPKTPLAILSTVSFGLGMTVGIWLLARLDGAAPTRMSRFWCDVIGGGLLVAFIYIFLLGFRAQPVVIGAAAAFVIIASLLFVGRKPREPRHQRR